MHYSHSIVLSAHPHILVCSTCCAICAGSYWVLCFQYICLFVCETLYIFVGHIFNIYLPEGKREEEKGEGTAISTPLACFYNNFLCMLLRGVCYVFKAQQGILSYFLVCIFNLNISQLNLNSITIRRFYSILSFIRLIPDTVIALFNLYELEENYEYHTYQT